MGLQHNQNGSDVGANASLPIAYVMRPGVGGSARAPNVNAWALVRRFGLATGHGGQSACHPGCPGLGRAGAHLGRLGVCLLGLGLGWHRFWAWPNGLGRPPVLHLHTGLMCPNHVHTIICSMVYSPLVFA